MMVFQFIGIQIFSALYLMLLLIVYNSKKRYISIENDVFRMLLTSTVIMLVVDILSNYTIKYSDLFPILNIILGKTTFLGYQLWAAMLMLYVLLLGNKKKYKNIKELFKTNKKAVFGLITVIILAVISLFFPLETVYLPEYNISYLAGVCTNYVYTVTIIYFI